MWYGRCTLSSEALENRSSSGRLTSDCAQAVCTDSSLCQWNDMNGLGSARTTPSPTPCRAWRLHEWGELSFGRKPDEMGEEEGAFSELELREEAAGKPYLPHHHSTRRNFFFVRGWFKFLYSWWCNPRNNTVRCWMSYLFSILNNYFSCNNTL